jgi:hypothetical protein
MRSSFFSIALLASTTLATSQPTEQGIRVHQVSSGRQHIRSGPQRYAHSLSKWSKAIPEHVRSAARKDSTKQQGDVEADSINFDQEYLCPVAIGTPAQTLNLDFDTGSSDLWVFSGQLPAEASQGHSLFRVTESRTAMLTSGARWQISYGDGSGASGNVFADKVVVGGVTATSMAVECATSVSSGFTADVVNNGLLGLALSSINTIRPKQSLTSFDTIQASLPSQLFTAFLRHNAPGTYTFGYLNQSEYQGDITYAPLNTRNGFWQFDAAGYAVGTRKIPQTLSCIADTGTSLILMPDNVLRAYYTQVRHAQNSNAYGGWVFPCSSSLPTLGVTIGKKTFEVPGSIMNYAQLDDKLCYGGLQSSAGIGYSILGDVFLKNTFAVFDLGGQRVGFAKQK